MAKQNQSSIEIPKIGCEKCDGFGNLVTPDGAKDCECRVNAMRYVLLANAQIPPMFIKKTIDNFANKTTNQKEVLKTARQFIDTFKPGAQGLLFLGDCGTGKTHLAVGVLREIALKGHGGLFYNVIQLLDELRSSFDEGNRVSQWPILDRLYTAQLLVLDDLGAEKTSGWVNDRLYAIINHRYEHQKTTILTSNKMGSELNEQIGNRAYSRLMEMCKAVLFTGKDYRIQMMQGKIQL